MAPSHIGGHWWVNVGKMIPPTPVRRVCSTGREHESEPPVDGSDHTSWLGYQLGDAVIALVPKAAGASATDSPPVSTVYNRFWLSALRKTKAQRSAVPSL
jgi:hypothetical protein